MFVSNLTLLEKIADRVTGPLHFRFIFQPLVSILLGIRDGKRDAKAGITPFLWDLFISHENHERNIKIAIETLLKPIIFGVILDSVAQYLIFDHYVNIGGAVLVGTFIIAVPYMLSREITNRIIRK